MLPAFLMVVLLSGCGGREAAPASQPADAPLPPGTLHSSALEIRVQLAEDIERFDLAVDGPCEVYAVEDPDLPMRLTGLEPRTIVLSGGQPPGFEMLGRRWTGAVEIVPHEAASLRLRLRASDPFVAYRGTLRVNLDGQGRLELVNRLDLEEYLRGVVPSEMPGTFHPEALRAQAIAARTYALFQRNTVGMRRTWDVRADQSSQVYRGLSAQAEAPEAVRAVDATRGVVCTWNSPLGRRIFCTYYSSTCGGRTVSAAAIRGGDVPAPLAGGVPCEYCANSRWYRWEPQTISKATITANLRTRFPPVREIGPVEQVEPLDETGAGRPTAIRITDAEGGTVTLRAEEFRLGVDPTGRVLRSTDFQVRCEERSITFYDGRGWGHGVGLCQYGAEGMARSGKSAAAILAYYYPGSQLALAYK